MPNNVTLNAGSGGDIISTEDIAGVEYQRIKLIDGTTASTTAIASGGGVEAGALRVTVASDSTGVLSVDDNGGSITVDGTVTANAGTGTMTVDGSAVTQPVSGTVTANAGTGTMTVDGSAVTQPISNAAVDNAHSADYDTGAGTDTTSAFGIAVPASGGAVAVTGDAANGLDVDVTRVGGTVTVDGSAVTQPVSAASLPLPAGAATSAAQLPDGHNVTVDNASGASAVNIQDGGNSITIDGTVTANAGTGTMTVDGSGVTQPVSGTITANLSATDNTVLDNIDTNTSAAASLYRNVDANAESAIKASAGTLYWLHVMNMTAAVAYLHLYNATTASVTPGTTVPDFTFPIPTQGDTNGAGFNLPLGGNGQDFSTAITLVVTTTIDGAAGDPGLNGVFVNAGYT